MLLGLALLCLAASAHPAASAGAGARKMVGVYELRKGDFSVKVTNFGARLMSVVFPDSKGARGVLDPCRRALVSCPVAGMIFFRSVSCQDLFLSGVLLCREFGRCRPWQGHHRGIRRKISETTLNVLLLS
jgi:hypothetical protein